MTSKKKRKIEKNESYLKKNGMNWSVPTREVIPALLLRLLVQFVLIPLLFPYTDRAM